MNSAVYKHICFFVEIKNIFGNDARLSLDIYQTFPLDVRDAKDLLLNNFIYGFWGNLRNGSLRKSCACHFSLISLSSFLRVLRALKYWVARKGLYLCVLMPSKPQQQQQLLTSWLFCMTNFATTVLIFFFWFVYRKWHEKDDKKKKKK